MSTKTAKSGPPPFEIFRAADARDYDQSGPMHMAPTSDTEMAGMAAMAEAGMVEGSRVKLLHSRPGMSLTYAWFKSGFPLPLHSHSTDCLYFVVAGSLRIGTETLGPGDGFFLGTDVPYTYVPGDEGLEILEFRTSNSFDFKSLGRTAAYWGKALNNLNAARESWDAETAPPSGLKIG